MTKYIWITIGAIGLILLLAWKQAGKEPEPVVPPSPPPTAEQPQSTPETTPTATSTSVTLPIAK